MDAEECQERKAALIAEITAAFDGVSRADGVSLSESAVIDNYGSIEERGKARARDTETKWQDVDEDGICFGYEVMNFLDAKGFHYYLPAFMTWCLRTMDSEDPKLANSMTFEFLIYHLQAGHRGEIGEHYLAKFNRLSSAQSKSVAHFLEFTAAREDSCNSEFEVVQRENFRRDGKTEEEYDAHKEFISQKFENVTPENDSRHALERYWGQFL